MVILIYLVGCVSFFSEVCRNQMDITYHSFEPFSFPYDAYSFPYRYSISLVFFSVCLHIPSLLIPESCVTISTINNLTRSIRLNIHFRVSVLTNHCVFVRNLYHRHGWPTNIISHWYDYPLHRLDTYYLSLSIHTNYILYPFPFP